MSPYHISEKETRYSIIDPLLKQAGWNLVDHTKVGFEIPVENYDKTFVTGFTDYCLYTDDDQDKVNSTFLVYLLGNKSFRKIIRSKCKTSAGQYNINTKGLGGLSIILPDLNNQVKFAEIVQKVEILKEKQKESEKELDNLFNSLMQKAFKGDLF